MLHHVPPHEQVVELVGAADLDVGLDRDGVVALGERVEELRDRDRVALRETLGEIVALEQPGDRPGARQPDELRVVELPQPFAVEADLGAVTVEDAEGLLGEELGVAVEHFVRQDPALLRAAGRIADPRRVVADDQDGDVARVLEGAQPAQDDREAEVDVRAGRVDPELDAQGAAERELALQLALREDVDGVGEEVQADDSRRPGRGPSLAARRGPSRRRTG